MPQKLRRTQRLRNGGDFRRILRRGRRLDGPLFLARVLEGDSAHARIGLAVGRKLGGAVRRNRARRLLRECFRLESAQLLGAVDVVLIAKPELLACDLEQVRNEFGRRFRGRARAGRAGADGGD